LELVLYRKRKKKEKTKEKEKWKKGNGPATAAWAEAQRRRPDVLPSSPLTARERQQAAWATRLPGQGPAGRSPAPDAACPPSSLPSHSGARRARETRQREDGRSTLASPAHAPPHLRAIGAIAGRGDSQVSQRRPIAVALTD